MTTAYTSLLGLALPVTGELSGTWGDTVNNSITSLLDTAVAGTTTLSTDADVTLTTTTGASNQARQAIILWTASGTVTRYITAPAQSKIYTVINKTGSTQSIVLRGVGPTTGVTIPAGSAGTFAWNGTDFVDVSGYVNGNLTINGTLTVTGVTTLKNNLLFSADNAYDIGASGATRPRNYYGAGTGTFGGNVGIGIAPVAVANHTTLTIDNATNGGLFSIYKNGVSSGYIRGNSNDGTGTNLVIGSSTGNGIQFCVNGTTTVAATLDSSSNWLVGTTTNLAPYKAVITGTSLRYGLLVKGNFASSLTENNFANDGASGVTIGQYGSTYSGGSNFGVGALGSFVAGNDAAPFAVGTTTTQPLWFGTNNSFVAQIDANGRTQFGTQSLPSGCTSYLLLSRSANNNTDATITTYNSSTGTAATTGLIFGTNSGSNVGGIGAFGGNYTSSGQSRPNQTYIWNNVSGGSITIHHEQANGSIYNAIGNTTVSTITSGGLRINSGNIGLDVDPSSITYDPNYRLIYMGNSAVYGTIYGSSNGTGGSNEWGQTAWQNNTRFYGSTNYAIGTGAASAILQSGGAIYCYSAPSVSAGAVQTLSQRSKFDLNGFTTINSANVSTGASPSAIFLINHPYATSANAYQNGYGFLTPNMATNSYNTMVFGGAAATTNNAGYMAFQYAGGSGSSLNKLSWGLWNNDNLMQLDGSGRLSINQSTQYGILNITPLTPSWGEGMVINPSSNGYAGIYFRKEGATGSTYTGTWAISKNSSGFNGGNQFLGIIEEGLTGSNLQRVDAAMIWDTSGTTYANKLIVNTTTSRYADGYIQQNGGKLILNTTDGNYCSMQIGNPTAGGEASIFMFSGATGYGTSPTASSTTYMWAMGAGVYGNTPDYFVIGNVANAQWNVRLAYNATAWAGNSDERIKNIIKPITNALDMMRDWRTVYFTFNHDTSNRVKMGLIAQDVLKTAPELVDVPENEYNSKGELQTMGVYYAEAIPVLVKAIKELEAKILTLETKLQGA